MDCYNMRWNTTHFLVSLKDDLYLLSSLQTRTSARGEVGEVVIIMFPIPLQTRTTLVG